MFAAMQARLAAAAAAAELGLPPDAAEEVLAFAQRSGVDFDSFGTERSSSEIIEAHNKGLRRTMQQLQQQQQEDLYMVRASQSRDVKPAADFPQPPPFSALNPISCQDLQLQTTHRCAAVARDITVTLSTSCWLYLEWTGSWALPRYCRHSSH